jgi:hypothetical protein
VITPNAEKIYLKNGMGLKGIVFDEKLFVFSRSRKRWIRRIQQVKKKFPLKKRTCQIIEIILPSCRSAYFELHFEN